MSIAEIIRGWKNSPAHLFEVLGGRKKAPWVDAALQELTGETLARINGGATLDFTVAFLLPAVQKVREAAARTQ